MRRITSYKGDEMPIGTIRLTHAERERARQVVTLPGGEAAALLQERGATLKPGTLVAIENGPVFSIEAADEALSVVSASSCLEVVRAAYHLGNRHVRVAVSETGLTFLEDHVLESMLQQLGLSVARRSGPFEPEPGAYGAHSRHTHEHSHVPHDRAGLEHGAPTPDGAGHAHGDV